MASSSLARSMYASDASLYRIPPLAVVRPRVGEEILAVLAVAKECVTPVTMRGAGTSIAGNAVGPGIVIDTSRHLNNVLHVDGEARTATVEPGVVHAHLQRQALAVGLRFGPDPSTHSRCTIGGMIGNNACGSRALGYGRTADNIVALDAVRGDGSAISTPDLAALNAIVDANLGLIRTEFGRFARQVSGYSMEHLLPENGRAMERFLVGTEGTLAVVLEASVRLVEDAPFRALAVLGFPDMAAAADAVPALLAHPLTACEGLDRRMIDLVEVRPDLPAGSGWLLAEVTGDSEGEVRALAEAVCVTAGVAHRVVTGSFEQAALWRIREDGAGLAARSLSRPAHSGWEDAAVPPQRLGDYLRGFEELLREANLEAVPYGHFGDGCVHARIDFELGDSGGRHRFRQFVEAAADLAASFGGSMSGEHGDGRARSELLPRMYSAEAIAVMAEVKHLLDPDNLLNPGVLVAPEALDSGLRLSAGPTGPLVDLFADVHRCTGVGKCLADTTDAGGVMCPSYLATRDEQDSTRGRARVLQDVTAGHLSVADPAVDEALDLCLSCKGCARDCPTGVDMATYKSQALSVKYAGKRRPRSHYALGRLPKWAAMSPPRLVNRMLRGAISSRLAKRVAGVDRRRSLPLFSEQPLRNSAIRKSREPSTPDVWLWADTFTDHFAADVGRATLGLLEEAGIRAAVIPERACCALTWITTGQLDQARGILAMTLDVLHPYARTGVPIIGLEPSCLATLRGDAIELTGDPRCQGGLGGDQDARRIPDRTRLAPARSDRTRDRRAAALPPCGDPGLRRRSGAAGANWSEPHRSRRMLRTGRQLRGREGPLRDQCGDCRTRLLACGAQPPCDGWRSGRGPR